MALKEEFDFIGEFVTLLLGFITCYFTMLMSSHLFFKELELDYIKLDFFLLTKSQQALPFLIKS